MITQTVTVTEKGSQNIIIGRRNTYGTEVIVFDLSYLIETFGDGSAILMVKRSTDSTAYPAVTEQIDNRLSWSISDVDTSYKGHGEAELFWYVDDALAKSVIYDITVLRDIGETTETPPDPYQTWVDTLTDLGAETLENAQAAAQSAEDANTAKVAAETAQGKAETAQEKAETAQGKAETAQEKAEIAQGKAEDAQEAAESAVEHYPKIVNGYWYVWQNGEWVNTGVKAEGSDGREIVSVTCEKTGTSGLVDTYTMTITFNSGNPDTVQFLVTNGEDGYSPVVTITTITGGHRVTITDKTHPDGQSFDVTDGIDGVSPDVTITTITGGHRVTITDEDHPLGQSFDVMDGTNTDAEHVTYDDTASYSDGTVGKKLSDLNSAISDLTINKADVIVSSASGAIASFSDGMEAPIKSLEVEIEPVQDLHGYDNPWPPGGGKQKLPCEAESATITGVQFTVDGEGVVTAKRTDTSNMNPKIFNYGHVTLSAGTYIANGITGGSPSTNYIELLTGAYDGTRLMYYTDGDNSFTLAEETTVYARCVVATLGLPNVNDTKTYSPMIRLSTESDATFAPYENLCPISGHTGLTVYRTGENLYSRDNGQYNVPFYATDGTATAYADVNVVWIKVKPNTKYTITNQPNDKTYYVRWIECDENKGYVWRDPSTMTQSVSTRTYTTRANTHYLQIAANQWNAASISSNDWEVCIQEGTDATFYPYTGNTYPITFPDAAGTVYGGTDEVVSGQGSNEMTKLKLLSSFAWQENGTAGSDRRFGFPYGSYPDYIKSANQNGTFISNTLAPHSIGYNGHAFGTFYISNAWIVVHDNNSHFATLEDFKEWLDSEDVYIVYKVATPQPYTHEPQQITTLYGDNNVWANTGDVSLRYRANTKLYIDGKLAELVAQIVNS